MSCCNFHATGGHPLDRCGYDPAPKVYGVTLRLEWPVWPDADVDKQFGELRSEAHREALAREDADAPWRQIVTAFGDIVWLAVAEQAKRDDEGQPVFIGRCTLLGVGARQTRTRRTLLDAKGDAEKLAAEMLEKFAANIQNTLGILRWPRCRAICPEPGLAAGEQCRLSAEPHHNIHVANIPHGETSWPDHRTVRWAKDGAESVESVATDEQVEQALPKLPSDAKSPLLRSGKHFGVVCEDCAKMWMDGRWVDRCGPSVSLVRALGHGRTCKGGARGGTPARSDARQVRRTRKGHVKKTHQDIWNKAVDVVGIEALEKLARHDLVVGDRAMLDRFVAEQKKSNDRIRETAAAAMRAIGIETMRVEIVYTDGNPVIIATAPAGDERELALTAARLLFDLWEPPEGWRRRDVPSAPHVGDTTDVPIYGAPAPETQGEKPSEKGGDPG